MQIYRPSASDTQAGDVELATLAESIAGTTTGATGRRLAVANENLPAAVASLTGFGAPTNAAYVTLSTNGILTDERVLTGTANQITVTDGGAGNPVTLSTPQNIDTAATPRFSGLEIGHASDTTVTRSAAGRLAVEGVDLVSISATQTLTNKTVNLSSNTLTGTVAEFNTALSDGNFATIAGIETLTNKTLTTPTIDARKAALTIDSDGGTVTFDMNTSDKHTVTLGGNRILAVSNVGVGQCFLINLVQDATGSRTVTWFSTIKWPAGSAPTLTTTANKTDVFGFVCTSSGNYLGFIIAQNL